MGHIYSSPSYVAWLSDKQIVVDMYRPQPGHWLPKPPTGWPPPNVMAIDGPQGLAAPNADPAIRKADAETNTPMRRLPRSRQELAFWELYKPLILLSIDLFWYCYQNPAYSIYGLNNTGCLVCETWPRLILKRLGGLKTLPSKRKDPFAYSDKIFDPPHELTLDSKKIVMLHDPVVLDALIQSGRYDLILYGHTHEIDIRKQRPLVVNPGELGGWLTNKSTMAVWDTQTDEIELVEI